MKTQRKVGRDHRACRVRKSTNASGAPGGRALPQQLLRDAAEWRLISLLFECPGKDWQSQVTALAGEVADPALKAAAAAIGEDGTPSLYQTTFGPGGPAAPREVSHRETLMPGQMLGELGAFYDAFAYQPAIPEPPDHIAVMTGFIAYLRLKEAYAVERDDTEPAAVVADAARKFIEEHLNTIAEPLAKTLAHSGIAYLAQAAAALLQRVGPRRPIAATQPLPMAACAVADGCAWPDEEA